jgi:hypothetical protein
MAVQCHPIYGSPPEEKKNQAFVLMPFRNARLNEIYKTIVKHFEFERQPILG